MSENATSLPKWNTGELLCLAYVISKKQEHVPFRSISRSVESICADFGRPQNWYSEKNCRRQYVQLLNATKEEQMKFASPGTKKIPTAQEVLEYINAKHDEEIDEMCQQIDLDATIEALNREFNVDNSDEH